MTYERVRHLSLPENFSGTYYIVARTAERAKEIAFKCVAANAYPQPEANERPPSDGEDLVDVWVMTDWAAETESPTEGLIGSGSENLVAKALALYVKSTGRLH